MVSPNFYKNKNILKMHQLEKTDYKMIKIYIIFYYL